MDCFYVQQASDLKKALDELSIRLIMAKFPFYEAKNPKLRRTASTQIHDLIRVPLSVKVEDDSIVVHCHSAHKVYYELVFSGERANLRGSVRSTEKVVNVDLSAVIHWKMRGRR